MSRWQGDDYVFAACVALVICLIVFVAGVWYGIRWYDNEYRPSIMEAERCE